MTLAASFNGGGDMGVAKLEPICVEDPAAGFAAAFEELMTLVQAGYLSFVGICVKLPNGSHHEIPIGETAEERAVILQSVKSALVRSHH